MNEATSLITPFEPIAPTYKDRSTGLLIFGILTILLGCLTGLLIILMLVEQGMAARTNQMPSNAAAILPAIVTYAILSVALIWLGIGSIQVQRWARALLLIFSWSWLMLGILMLIMMAWFLPAAFKNLPAAGAANQPAMPPGAMSAVMVVMFLFFGFFFVVLPVVWIFFYASRHVKATCEARNVASCWTDACPLPVLGLCLWLIFGALMMLLAPVMYHSVVPFFGFFLTGLPGTLFYLALTFLWGYAAWLMYRLKPQGWWLIFIALVLFMGSGLITFARHDPLEMYHLMGYPEKQIEQIEKSGLLVGNRMYWGRILTLSLR